MADLSCGHVFFVDDRDHIVKDALDAIPVAPLKKMKEEALKMQKIMIKRRKCSAKKKKI